MSEFKFACPVCGQHITCPDSSGGTQMECPTCFRKLVVPHAPKGNGALILTATQAQSRPSTSIEAASATRSRSSRSLPFWVWLVLAVAVVAGGAVWAQRSGWLERIFKRSSGVVNTVQSNIPNSDPSWTLNATEAHIPESPAEGSVHGENFQLQRSTISGGTLNLRQGRAWPPDLGVTVYLHANAAEDLAGKSIVVGPDLPQAPRVTLRWKDGQEAPVTKSFRSSYLLKVEFGKPTDGKLPGRIYLAMSDEFRSRVSGTFEAEIRTPKPKK